MAATSPFKDSIGRWRSKSLFIEFAHPDYPALFTLAEDDREVDGTTYISAKRKYLEYKDPTEHTFANAVFSSYQCWSAVCASPDILPHIQIWREELELHLRAIGINALVEKAKAGDVNAAKALATGSYKAKRSKPSGEELRPAGRPRKTGFTPDHAKDHASAYERLRFEKVPILITTTTTTDRTTPYAVATTSPVEVIYD